MNAAAATVVLGELKDRLLSDFHPRRNIVIVFVIGQ
jgi:hypothetical protein